MWSLIKFDDMKRYWFKAVQISENVICRVLIIACNKISEINDAKAFSILEVYKTKHNYKIRFNYLFSKVDQYVFKKTHTFSYLQQLIKLSFRI